MTKVELAELPAVSRSQQPLRDKQEAAGDLFAAVFDSACRSTGSRIDRTVREGQRNVVSENRSASKKEKAAPPEDRQTRKRLEDPAGRLDSPGSVEKRRSEPVKKEADRVKPQAESDQPSRVDAAEDSSPTAEQAETRDVPEQATPENEASPESEPATAADGQIESTNCEAVDSEAGQTQVAVGGDVTACTQFRQSAPQEIQAEPMTIPAETPVPESADVPAVANPVAMMMLDLLTPCEESTGGPDQCGAPQAASSLATTAPTNSDEAIAQAASGEVVSQSPEKSISIWQLLRGVAAHLEQVMEMQARGQGGNPVVPAEGAKQNPAAEVSAARPAASQIATAMLTAGLDGVSATWKQNQEQSDAQSRDDGAAQGDSAGKAARSGETSTHQTGATEDFRNLIEVASRIRDQISSPNLTPGSTLIGRETAGKGVGLSEARAVTDLADVVRANIGARHSSMVLRLDPPELGQVRIDVRMHGEELSLRLQADTLVGRDALMSRLNDLRGALEQHGFKLNQVEVELRIPQGPPPESHQERSPHQQGQWDGQTSQGPGWQGQAADGGETSSGSNSSNEDSAFSQENASSREERGWVERPAETGVDLVV